MEMIIKHRFLTLGILILFIGSIIFVYKVKIKENGVESKAKVISVSQEIKYDEDNKETINYTAYVEYEVDGKRYNGKYNTSNIISKGSYIKIYYDKDNPGIMVTDTNTISAVIIIVIGGFFIMIGLVNIFTKNYLKN